MYHQDEPVIGAAMFPMYHVSKLAARQVKVCLGGQAGDEISAGTRAMRWHALKCPLGFGFKGRTGRRVPPCSKRELAAIFRGRLANRRTLHRLSRNARHLWNWKSRYFENFVNVPEAGWKAVLEQGRFAQPRAMPPAFHEVTLRSAATDPADKVMHWDLQTYLPGLFHQDDRMSMAASLESRVPLADPRMVLFAMHTGFDLKFRGGASKWLLRKAVSDVLPDWILNRRKVGFDTPAEGWMRGQHAGFVRDLLLSQQSKNRGMWNLQGIEALLQNTTFPHWFDVTWKLVCLEAWARVFLDGSSLCPRAQEDSPAYVHTASEARALLPGRNGVSEGQPSRSSTGGSRGRARSCGTARRLGGKDTVGHCGTWRPRYEEWARAVTIG